MKLYYTIRIHIASSFCKKLWLIQMTWILAQSKPEIFGHNAEILPENFQKRTRQKPGPSFGQRGQGAVSPSEQWMVVTLEGIALVSLVIVVHCATVPVKLMAVKLV